MAGIPDKTIIFRKFDLWWPLLTSIFTWAKKWPKWLRTGSLRAVDRRISRPSSFPSFRVRGGSFWPPPPTMAKVAETATRARVKVEQWFLYHRACLVKGRVSTDIGNMELWTRGWRIYFSELTVSFKPQGNSSIRCILSTPEQNLLLRIIGCSYYSGYRLHPNTFHNTINKNVNHSNDTIDNLNQSSFHKPARQCQGHL